jgi:hypothetical protein
VQRSAQLSFFDEQNLDPEKIIDTFFQVVEASTQEDRATLSLRAKKNKLLELVWKVV